MAKKLPKYAEVRPDVIHGNKILDDNHYAIYAVALSDHGGIRPIYAMGYVAPVAEDNGPATRYVMRALNLESDDTKLSVGMVGARITRFTPGEVNNDYVVSAREILGYSVLRSSDIAGGVDLEDI